MPGGLPPCPAFWCSTCAASSVPTSCFHDVAGVRMHARVAGHGPDVVLVHGVVASHRYWEPTVALLGTTCRAWAPDLPGYGLSQQARPQTIDEQADALAHWMGAAGIERGHVVGNSAGCQVAAALAQRHPALLERLVLHGPTVDPAARGFGRQSLRWAGAMVHEPYRPVAKAWKDVQDMGAWRAVQQIRHMLVDRIEQRLPHVQVPTLVVRGRQDPIVPQRWAEEAVGLLPDGQLALVEGSHIINETQPEVLVDALAPFLGLAASTKT